MQKLKIQYAIFFAIVLFCFGFIVISQKLTPIFEKKADKEINAYIEENFNDLKDVRKEKTNYINNKYTKIIRHKDNKNYYFKISYKNKKITDTHKKDYVEGSTFLKYISKKIQKEIKDKVQKEYTVIISSKLNKFSEKTKVNIIKEKDLLSSEIFTLEIKVESEFNTYSLTNSLTSIHNKLLNNNIKAESYNFIISDSKSNKEMKINNLKINKNLKYILTDIINDKESDYLKQNNITYEILK